MIPHLSKRWSSFSSQGVYDKDFWINLGTRLIHVLYEGSNSAFRVSQI